MVRATRNVGLLTSPQKCGKWVLHFRSSVPTPRYYYTEAAAQGHEKVVSFLLSHFKALLQFENSQGTGAGAPLRWKEPRHLFGDFPAAPALRRHLGACPTI